MSFDPKITFSNISKAIGSKMNKACSKVGEALERSPHKDKFEKLIKAVDPTGANNSFIVMVALMVFGVIIPRLITALKRNPDDKEATKDELTEIARRDIQTVLIILFALKSTNTLVANKATKITGLPMTNKPYQSIFNSKEKGVKGFKEKTHEFIDAPVEKLKTIGKNILDTLHPTGGSIALTNDEFSAKYANYNSIDEIIKMLKEIPSQGGDSQKVFNKIVDSLIEQQKALIEGNPTKGLSGLIQKAKQTAGKNGSFTPLSEKEIENAKEILTELQSLKGKDYTVLQDKNTSDAVKNVVVSFFQGSNNALLRSAKRLNAALRTAALAFEATYLGFGLPAINERLLEKKYLEKNPQKNASNNTSNQSNSNDILIKNRLKPQNNKAFQNFIKTV